MHLLLQHQHRQQQQQQPTKTYMMWNRPDTRANGLFHPEIASIFKGINLNFCWSIDVRTRYEGSQYGGRRQYQAIRFKLDDFPSHDRTDIDVDRSHHRPRPVRPAAVLQIGKCRPVVRIQRHDTLVCMHVIIYRLY